MAATVRRRPQSAGGGRLYRHGFPAAHSLAPALSLIVPSKGMKKSNMYFIHRMVDKDDEQEFH